MGTFHVLTDVIVVPRNICQIESAIPKNIFLNSKISNWACCSLTSLNVTSNDYNNAFYLVALRGEIVVEKNGEQKNSN